MARKVAISSTRTKGPPTPNFGKVADLLEKNATTTIVFSKERASDQHGGIGIKMSFVCDLLEAIENLQKHEGKAIVQGENLYINADIFFGLVNTIDVYVFELYSILDYLAVELSEIFGLKVIRREKEKAVEYFIELIDVKSLQFGIGSLVKELIAESWFDYFHQLRNRVAHKTPVNFTGLVRHKDGKFVDFQYPFLPDNPKDIELTFKKELNVLDESRRWLEGIFSFVDKVSEALLTLFQTTLS